MTDRLQAEEAECARGREAPRVSLADLEANIAYRVSFIAGHAVLSLPDDFSRRSDDGTPESLFTLTICLLVTRSGFTIIGKSAPASAANFDAELGAKLAYEDAVRQLWPLMGYALRERLSASEPTGGEQAAPKRDGADPDGTLAAIEGNV